MTVAWVAVTAGLAVLLWPARDAGPGGPGPAVGTSPHARGRTVPRGVAGAAGRRHRMRRPGRATRSGTPGVAAVAEVAELVSLCLAAGLPAEQALDLATGRLGPGGGVAATLRAALDGTVVTSLGPSPPAASHGGQPGPVAPGSDLLVAAWSLSRDRGAPLTDVAATCARTLRAVESARRRQAAAAAGPRTSMWLLTLLPLLGPGAALLAGVDVRATYGTPVAAASTMSGLALTALGWAWGRRIIAGAERPELHR